jgi:hypothetical protein
MGKILRKCFIMKILNSELDENIGFENDKDSDDDEDESRYNYLNDDTDFFTLKKKEDKISRMIMRNFTEFSAQVGLN